jgi:Acetylaranotin biosynthesis cluster protein L
MYALSASMEVNPEAATQILSQDQMWRGLIMKAENAVPFVPGMHACEVLERYADGLLREIVIGGHRFKERITFTPPVQVLFERVDTDEHAGWITNVISEAGQRLMLTFTFAVNFPGVQPGSEDERKQGQQMKSSYVKAIEATLKEVRRLVSEGKL